MKRINKKVSLIIASSIILMPLLASAEMTTSTENATTNINVVMPISEQNMSWSITAEQKAKLWEIMKPLESDLKYIRENLTKENFEEMKKKAEELKLTYLTKVSELFPNLPEAKLIIENRFKIFFNNQFIIREQIKEVKDNFKNSVWTWVLLKAKETASWAINKIKEEKKIENTQIRQEIKQVKQDLKAKYKEKFLSQLQGKLDNIPVDKLQLVLDKVTKKREEIATNNKLTQTKKDSYLAQLDALIDILNDKLGNNTTDELNLDDLLNTDSTSSTSTSSN